MTLLPLNTNHDRPSILLHNDTDTTRPLVDVATTSIVNTAAIICCCGVHIAAAATGSMLLISICLAVARLVCHHKKYASFF